MERREPFKTKADSSSDVNITDKNSSDEPAQPHVVCKKPVAYSLTDEAKDGGTQDQPSLSTPKTKRDRAPDSGTSSEHQHKRGSFPFPPKRKWRVTGESQEQLLQEQDDKRDARSADRTRHKHNERVVMTTPPGMQPLEHNPKLKPKPTKTSTATSTLSLQERQDAQTQEIVKQMTEAFAKHLNTQDAAWEAERKEMQRQMTKLQKQLREAHLAKLGREWREAEERKDGRTLGRIRVQIDYWGEQERREMCDNEEAIAGATSAPSPPRPSTNRSTESRAAQNRHTTANDDKCEDELDRRLREYDEQLDEANAKHDAKVAALKEELEAAQKGEGGRTIQQIEKELKWETEPQKYLAEMLQAYYEKTRKPHNPSPGQGDGDGDE